MGNYEESKYLQAMRIMSYYLADKAMVRAIMNIGYDNNPELGEVFLRIAGYHMDRVEGWIKAYKEERRFDLARSS